jgi:hypothetical protein
MRIIHREREPEPVKVEIPNELKKDVPQSSWGKILTATPIIMTVVATALAGLSSSEMTRAQYDRSLGAQLQSKAGDQWNYFQAKKLRAAMQRNSLDLLRFTSDVRPPDFDAIEKATGVSRAVFAKIENAYIKADEPPALDSNVEAALAAVAASKPDSGVNLLLQNVSDLSLANALETAKDNARKFDAETTDATPALEAMERKLSTSDNTLFRNFTSLRMHYTATRYETEARLNQAVANIYELQVRKANVSAEHHHERSQRFFYGMLAAQVAVIIATFSLAAQHRSFLWSLAAAAGLAAIGLAIYVYLYV